MQRLDYFQEYWKQINDLRATGRRILDLGMGMPPSDVFATPDLLIAKLHESIDAGDYNLYVPPEGDHDCLAEIAEYENAQLPTGAPRYDEEHVMLVPGGIQAFSVLLSALVPPGEPILTPVPSYFSLTAQSELRSPTVALPCDDEYNFRAEDLKRTLGDHDRIGLMWFCQPNNPTGLYIRSDEFGRMLDVAAERDCIVVVDESCDNYRFDVHDGLPDGISSPSVIRIRTFSKEPNFAGYRLGYLLADPSVLARVKHVVPVTYGNPTVMATRSVLAEMRMRNGKLADGGNYHEVMAANHKRMRQSRDFLHEALRASGHVEEVLPPEACYYMFARFRFPGTGMDFFRRLLHEQSLNAVPGEVFGAPDEQAWLRICFARPVDVLRDGVDRIGQVLSTVADDT